MQDLIFTILRVDCRHVAKLIVRICRCMALYIIAQALQMWRWV